MQPSQAASSIRDDLEATDFESHLCTLGDARSSDLRAQTSGCGSVGPSRSASMMRLKVSKRGRPSSGRAIPTGLVVSTAAATVLIGCASAPTDSVDWPGFVASFAGDPEQRADYPQGVSKVAVSPQVTASIDSGATRFENWCAAHGGQGGQTHRLQASSAEASRFHAAVAAKLNADRAQGDDWVPSIAMVCVERKSGKLLAAMFSIQGQQREAFERDGRRFDRLIRVFFDGRQSEDFAAHYAFRDAERAARAAAESAAKRAARDQATTRLQTRPQVGDRTSLGVIVELRPPLALVQYDRRYREVTGRPPAEWLRMDSLIPPSD